MKIIINSILIVSMMLLICIIINLYKDRKKLRNKEVNEIKNTKYVISVIILIIMFVVYGILRNFK